MILHLLETSLTPSTSPEFTATVVIAGFGSVLLTLMLLIGVFQIFGKSVSASQLRAEKKKAEKLSEQMKKDEGVPAPPVIKSGAVPPPPAIEGEVPPEIVAVISAAVAAAEGGAVRITSVRRKNKPQSAVNPWAQAAVYDNTRPF